MKKSLATVLCMFLLITCKTTAQDHYQTDITIGPTQNSDIVMGISVRNLFGPIGIYWNTYGSGTAYAYAGGTSPDYSYLSDETNVSDRGVAETNIYGTSLGVSINLAWIINRQLNGLTANIGAGYVRIQEVSETYYYYVWHDHPELNTGNLVTYISNDRNAPVFEFMINYDFFSHEYITFGIQGGYSLHNGVLAQVFLGLKVPKDGD